MTESEELKQNADKQKAKQMVDRINDYLDELTAKIAYARKRRNYSLLIYTITWVSWLTSSFFTGYQIVFLSLFVFSLVYDQFCFTRLHGAQKEFTGVIKILRLLGYIPTPDQGGEKSTKKSVWEKGVELVESWATKKKKAQDKVFQPA